MGTAADWLSDRLRQLPALLKKRLDWVVGAVISIIVTTGKLVQTYDDFLGQALPQLPTLALYLLNVIVTVGILFIFALIMKPQNNVRYAVVVALSFQAIVASEINLEPLAGTDVPGTQTTRISDVYNPVEKLLSGQIDHGVEAEIGSELDRLQQAYRGPRGPRRLQAALEERLDREVSIKGKDRSKLLRKTQAILATSRSPEVKVRAIALQLYELSARDVVHDLTQPGK